MDLKIIKSTEMVIRPNMRFWGYDRSLDYQKYCGKTYGWKCGRGAHFAPKSHGSEPATTPDMSKQDVTKVVGVKDYIHTLKSGHFQKFATLVTSKHCLN